MSAPAVASVNVGERSALLERREQGAKTSFLEPFIKPAVYGGMDGLVSVFLAVLIGVVTQVGDGGGRSDTLLIVLSLALAKLFAGAFSMGVGELLSTKAEVMRTRRTTTTRASHSCPVSPAG